MQSSSDTVEINNNNNSASQNNLCNINKKQRHNKRNFQQHLLKKPIANDSWGSTIETVDPECTRIYFQNVNGITSTESLTAKWEDFIDTMKIKGCDIFGLSETNTNWKYYNIMNTLELPCINKFRNSRTNFSVNRFNPKSVNRYQPGGCMQTCTTHWTSRILSSINDHRKMGRWVGQSYRLKGDQSLIVITAYRSCLKNATNNKSTSIASYRQQVVMLMEEGIEDPDPRKIFIEDMINLIQELEMNPNHHIVLMLDANESIQDKEGSLRKLINSTTLTDVFSHLSGAECNIPTYYRDSRKIDYIFTSRNLFPYVKRCGILPFYQYNQSDHRGMFIDISNLLIDNKVELQRPSKRYIGSKNPGIDIYNYKQYIHQQFVNHRIYDKSANIFNLSHLDDSKYDIETQLNKLDKQITEIMLSSEQTFCKMKQDTEWSIELHQTSIMCNYWARRYKGIKNGIITTKQTTALYNSLKEDKQVEIDTLIDGRSYCELYRISRFQMIKYINYKKELRRHHKELRKNGLQHLKAIRTEKGQKKEAKIIQKIANCEMKRADWKTIKQTLRPIVRSGISSVEVPNLDENGSPTDDPDRAVSWKRLTDPTDIEERLLDRNIKHFGQAEGTLFTTNDITKHFEYEGTTTDVRNLLEGDLEIDNYNEVTEGAIALLTKLSNKPNMTNFDDHISFEDFKKALRKWNENTSTSPSGRHLGHYKCLLDTDHCDTKYNEVNKDPRENILKVYYHIILSALNTGTSIKRWQNCTTTMIEKIPGCSRVNKLRVIHLYEADYNIILKLIWARKLVWHAHDNEMLNMGQAGSRP